MGRPSNNAERRRQIVDGLLQVMARHGYDGASVASIAEAAGLSPGLVHYHFDNKREILLALVAELSSRVGERFEKRAVRARTAWQRLAAFIDAHLALGKDSDPDAVACWVALGAESLREAEIQAAYEAAVREQLTALERLVAEALRLEGRSTRQGRAIALGVLAAIQGAYQLALAARVTPPGFAAEIVRRMAEGLIQAEPRLKR